jgi:hypothetical protein
LWRAADHKTQPQSHAEQERTARPALKAIGTALRGREPVSLISKMETATTVRPIKAMLG